MMDTAMELSFWKEEPLSPVFSGLENQADVWKLFEDDVVKQAPQTPERDPSDTPESHGGWLPDSPGDSCDSLENSKLENYYHARANLASQLLEDLDVLIKEEPFSDPWYETKTDLPMFDDLPSPTPSLGKEESLAGAAHRPFASVSMSIPLNGYATATPALSFTAPDAPAAVLVPLTTVQQQQLQQLQQPALAESLQQLHHHQQQHYHHQPAVVVPNNNGGLLTTVVPLEPLQTLLEEFDVVYDKVEQSHGGALTPPQSPPHHHYTATNEYLPVQPVEPVQPVHPVQTIQQLQSQPFDDFTALTPNHQQQQLIREVDELVNTQPQSQESWPATFLSSFAPPSPCTSSNSCSSYSSSDSPAPASPETDDPEWRPDSPDADSSEAPVKAKAPARKRGSKRGAKPYSHEDKRMRKKEQNKNAATRYRIKKKAEVEEILGEENELKLKNDELSAKVGDLQQEIRYLKNLMREVFKMKGLIK